MTDSNSPLTPSELLIQKVIVRFLDKSLLPKADAAQLEELLTGGDSKPEDWRLLVEKALELENKEEMK